MPKLSQEKKLFKIAQNRSEAFQIEEKYKDLPHGWIQWKGTNVCMDIYCKCGYHSHVDADFAYQVKCPKCATIYACNGHIELIEVRDDGGETPVMEDVDWEHEEELDAYFKSKS